jgi:hypothetical protein
MSGPRRIEIAGVAGSGKSTLTRTLVAGRDGWRVADSLHTRLHAHWPYLAHSASGLLPLVGTTLRRRPVLSWEEIKFAIYVSEWHRYLRKREAEPGVVLLDQGPVFALARLLWGQKPATRGEPFGAWMDAMLRRWSDELDLVVWLDAPDQVLHERIRGREQRHEAKGKPEPDAVALLGTHRRAYRSVLAPIARVGRPPVLRFDSSRMSPDEIADAVGEAVGARPSRIPEAAWSLR